MTKTIFLKLAGALLACGFMASAVAQTEVALSDESGLPGDSVDVTFTFTGDGSLEGLQGEAIISDPSVFSNIDATNLCSGASAVVV
ncbi:MAG: hypothetical protein GVY32_11685, partial [Gammaproteobacteria bacterium]|nr:hypothetical protein [Gammaproteobacteria bacterium]